MKTSPLISSKDFLSKKHKIRIHDVSHTELSLDSLRIISVDKVKSHSLIAGGSQKGLAAKAPSSTLSSIVLDNAKGGVKRKLNFDADHSSDEDSTIRRENGKRRCLRDFLSINSSLIDTDSNTFSPSKNGRPSAASYSRSSISSSCRRRLFPYSKKKETDELQSPVLQQNIDTKKEIRLSLKKKFPGVPNSDNARSGLLLNLAFSKFNLPDPANSDKKSSVPCDFVDHASVSKTTKKEFIHYSSIKKDDSSSCRSPVFTAIKKVKRRLNLEEQENCSTAKENHSFACDQERTPKNSNTNVELKVAKVASAKKHSFAGLFPKKNDGDKQLPAGSARLSVDIISKKPQPSGDLFKNSRLRLSLRNKILDLSTFSADGANRSTADANINCRTSAETSSGIARESLQLSSNERSFNSKMSDIQKSKPKYDRIVVQRDSAERTRRDVERWKRLSIVSSDSLEKGSRQTSTGLSSRSNCCKARSSNSFIDAHLQRFLNDCSEMARLKLSNSKDASPIPMNETSCESLSNFDELQTADLIENTSIVDSENNLELVKSSTFIEESDSNSNSPFVKRNGAGDFSLSRRMIEDINSPEMERPVAKTVFTIENICTQESTDEGVESRIHNVTMDENSLTETSQKDEIIFSGSDSEEFETSRVVKINHKIEEAATPKSEFVNDVNVNHQSRNPEQPMIDTEDILNSQHKKRFRKKHGPDSLCGRLYRLVKREKSEAHIWEYESSKRETSVANAGVGDMPNGPVIFSIKKMWKEFSRLVILCSRIHSDVLDIPRLENLGTKVSHSVVVIIESELFPKSITSSSTFRVHPPWKILHSSTLNLQIIFRPSKIEMVSANGKPLLYKDSTLPLHPRTVERKQFCVCLNNVCDCVLPESYLTVMPSLLPFFSNFNIPSSCRLKSYNREDAQCVKCIDDLMIMYRLLYAEFFMDFEVLNIDCSLDEVFRPIICANDQAEMCCILIKGEMKNLNFLRVHKRYRFTGLIPWKAIPSRFVPTLVKYLKLTELDLISKLQTNGIYVFVLSGQDGNIIPYILN